jgi:hypothetical protein
MTESGRYDRTSARNPAPAHPRYHGDCRGCRLSARSKALGPAFIGLVAILLIVIPSPGHPAALSGSSDSASDSTGSALPANSAWSMLPPPRNTQPFSRADAAIDFEPSIGLGLLYGGRLLSGTVLNDTWTNDGDIPGHWANFSTRSSLSPPPLFGGSLVYDRADGYFVLFGGELANGTAYGGTWEFLNFQWIPISSSPLPSPPPEARAAMAFDTADNSVILLSATGASRTWSFHAGAWAMVSTSVGPSPRRDAVLSMDPRSGAVILFGGAASNSTGTIYNDTWRYVRGTWTPVSGAGGPAPSTSLANLYDPRYSSLLLLDQSNPSSVWNYASTGWVRTATSVSPPPRVGGMIDYDTPVNFTILFGGMTPNGSTQLSDAWGFNVPPAFFDRTLASAQIPWQILTGVGVVGVAPIIVTWLVRRRPPRRLPVSVPTPKPHAVPTS